MKALRVLAFLTAFSAFYLLVAGAHVNAHQAALSVPDWPLSYGQILASEWPGNVFYEQHHRATAATTLVLFIALFVVLRRRSELAAARRIANWAAGALAVQIVMGGLIVLTLNPPWLSAVHTLAAVITVVLIAAAALETRPAEPSADPESEELQRLYRRAGIGIGIVMLQVALGSVSRHPPAGELVFISTLMAHLLVGVLLLIWLSLLSLSGIRSSAPPTRRWGWLLLAGLVLQLVVGGVVFVISPEPFDQTWPPPAGFPNAHAAHIVLAAWIAFCLVAIRSRCGLGPAQAGEARARLA